MSSILEDQVLDQHGNPNPAAFTKYGPRVSVRVSLLVPHIQALNVHGMKAPKPMRGIGLIDTGASQTAIDRKFAQQARLPVVGRALSISALNKEIVRVHAGTIDIFDAAGNLWLSASKALHGLNLEPQGLVALIGRDLLSSCELIYNGREATFTLRQI